ncbi:hypothetical protein ACH5RR_011241 [Cinchona calisaya]|uniref:Uncharacterized protein n=1 Tax=Cinchona calisaya TaxID=153742 RepID=A0ABD3A7R8_9GENT
MPDKPFLPKYKKEPKVLLHKISDIQILGKTSILSLTNLGNPEVFLSFHPQILAQEKQKLNKVKVLETKKRRKKKELHIWTIIKLKKTLILIMQLASSLL